jgi:hypothetical protein
MFEMAYTFDERIVSDLHKDAYGYRPSTYWWSDWMSSTDDEKQETWDDLLVDLEISIKEEKDRHSAAEAAFAQLIQSTINYGARDEKTAIRWILQAKNISDFDLSYGSDYVAFLFDLPYKSKYDAVINEVCEQLKETC